LPLMVTELKIGDSGPDSVTLVCKLMMKPPGGVEALTCASAALSVPAPPVVPAEVVPLSLATVTLITVCACAPVASAKLAPRSAVRASSAARAAATALRCCGRAAHPAKGKREPIAPDPRAAAAGGARPPCRHADSCPRSMLREQRGQINSRLRVAMAI